MLNLEFMQGDNLTFMKVEAQMHRIWMGRKYLASHFRGKMHIYPLA